MIEPMRYLAAVAFVLVLATPAQARRVVQLPRLADLCPGNENWAKVEACIRRHGQLTIEHADADAKLVRVRAPSLISGLYLYRHRAKWEYLGELGVYADPELLGFSRVRFGPHAGYRVDAGVASSRGLSLDGVTTISAVFRERFTLVCFEGSFGCFAMTTACDMLVGGKAYYTFRGTLVYDHHELRVVGDRTAAGSICTQAEVVFRDQ